MAVKISFVSQTKKKPAQTFTINTTSLAPSHSDMFQPSKGHLQGVKLIHFNSKFNKTVFIHHSLVFSLRGRAGRNQSPVM